MDGGRTALHEPSSVGASRTIALAIFALALVVRVAFLVGHPQPLASDALDYDQLGWTLAQTGHYAVDGAPTAYRPPGYPAFLAIVYWVVGHHPGAVKGVQALLDSLAAVALFRILRGRSLSAATIAGTTWALFPAAILFSSTLLSETLFACGVVAFAGLVGKDRAWSDWAAGAVLGGLILVKPMMLLIFAAAIPFALWKRPSARPTTRILVVAILPVAAWVLRNLLVLGAPAITTNLGANLLIGNNPNATGGYMTPPASSAAAASMSEWERDRAAGQAALRNIEANPTRALAVGARKVALLAASDAELTAGTFAGGAEGSRLRDRYREVPAWLRAVVNVPTALILLAGIFGLATRSGGVEARLFAALLFAIAMSSFLFFGGSRFRFPLMPLMVLAGAQFVTTAGRSLREAHRGRLVAALAVSTAIAAIWIAEALVLAGQSPLGLE